VAGQQRLEIVKSLAHGARVLILDEPTAVLAPTEAVELLEWLRRFADAGNAAVLITHRLDEALRVADQITVLRRGKLVLSAPATSLDKTRLSEAMIGESDVGASAPPLRTDRIPARSSRGSRMCRSRTSAVSRR
jgi:simple sugar transport system ATP-binding protein